MQIKTPEDDCWPGINKLADRQQYDELYEVCLPLFQGIVEKEKFSPDVQSNLFRQFKNIHIPLSTWLSQKHQNKPVVIGINGAKGSGKSTLSRTLHLLLSVAFNKSVLHLSIDDLYLARHERLKKANDIHPLLKVRGVPGTHDVKLGNEILSGLINTKQGINIKIPRFNKAVDDLFPEAEWQNLVTGVDIILFEGWCVGAKAQQQDDLHTPVNRLEQQYDPDRVWRNYVNQQLAESYQGLFNKIDYLVMLKVPDMESVFEWRCLQEEKLAAESAEKNEPDSQLMSEEDLRNFIMHYERITRWCLEEMPARADVLLELNKQHQVHHVKVKEHNE